MAISDENSWVESYTYPVKEG